MKRHCSNPLDNGTHRIDTMLANLPIQNISPLFLFHLFHGCPLLYHMFIIDNNVLQYHINAAQCTRRLNIMS